MTEPSNSSRESSFFMVGLIIFSKKSGRKKEKNIFKFFNHYYIADF